MYIPTYPKSFNHLLDAVYTLVFLPIPNEKNSNDVDVVPLKIVIPILLRARPIAEKVSTPPYSFSYQNHLENPNKRIMIQKYM